MDVRTRADGVRIVDDSYNANPDSMRAGLRALVALAPPGGGDTRRVAVLGEMLELGADSAAEHTALGADAARLGVDVLVAVGAGTAPLAAGARDAGADGPDVVEVGDVDAAREYLDAVLRPGDTVLLKGSNGSGIWRLADALLPERVADGVMPA
jgi:UDP-N-acetylmuramoyl-tripeptide--D-alanyl-D-alanine ligase